MNQTQISQYANQESEQTRLSSTATEQQTTYKGLTMIRVSKQPIYLIKLNGLRLITPKKIHLIKFKV